MSGANASPAGRSHQEMSGANASPVGRSHQEMSGANASPIGRSHKEMNRKTLVGLMLLAIVVSGSSAVMVGSVVADTRLAYAAMQGDSAAVRNLLQQKVDVNAAQGDGTTALHWAVYRDDLEMAQLLIKAGARLGVTTRVGEMTPLFMAAKNGNAAMIDALIKAGSAPNTAG